MDVKGVDVREDKINEVNDVNKIRKINKQIIKLMTKNEDKNSDDEQMRYVKLWMLFSLASAL